MIAEITDNSVYDIFSMRISLNILIATRNTSITFINKDLIDDSRIQHAKRKICIPSMNTRNQN